MATSKAKSPSDRHVELRQNLDKAVEGLGIYPLEGEIKKVEPVPIRRLRRRGPGAVVHDNMGVMTLVEEGGILRWREGYGFYRRYRRAGRRRGPQLRGEVIQQYKFERLQPSTVGRALEKFDDKLTPTRGLRVWTGGKNYKSLTEAPSGGTHLLIVHGTFSRGDAIIQNISKTAHGRDFLTDALSKYDKVLTFDHPTVSVSPFLNAVDLKRAFSASGATIDVICHSRGGLVTRWWLEALNEKPARCRRAVLVGSPLGGTSLAAPPRLRSAMDMLSNVWDVCQKGTSLASSLFPILTVVTGIMRVFSSVTRVAAKTPVLDAAVAMIPGLAAQSRTGDNPELQRLQSDAAPPPSTEYFAVASDFEPTDPGWAFWQYFTDKPKHRLLDALADPVFDGANDLVVDTPSMTRLTDGLQISSKKTLDFKTNDTVHHLNYFEQKRTIDFFRNVLNV